MRGADGGTDDLSPLIVNSGANEAHGVEVPVRNGGNKKSWFRQVSTGLSERWSHHVGSIGYLGSMSIAVKYDHRIFVLLVKFDPVSLIFCVSCSQLTDRSRNVKLTRHISKSRIHTDGLDPNFRGYPFFIVLKEIEYSECFESFWGHRSFILTQILFFFCITCLNVSSIVDTSQVVDTFFGHLFDGGSAAVQFSWEEGPSVGVIRWDYSACSEQTKLDGDCVPFATDGGNVLTLGYIVSCAIFVPMALMDLKVRIVEWLLAVVVFSQRNVLVYQENAAWQILGFLVLLVCSVIFVILFMVGGLHPEYVSLWGERWDTLFGVILFNYALVIAVPAWLYEKDPHVEVPTVVGGSSILFGMSPIQRFDENEPYGKGFTLEEYSKPAGGFLALFYGLAFLYWGLGDAAALLGWDDIH
eukprot:scaffold22660_cov127-Cylindrotheca_fusiformis.AAC.12